MSLPAIKKWVGEKYGGALADGWPRLVLKAVRGATDAGDLVQARACMGGMGHACMGGFSFSRRLRAPCTRCSCESPCVARSRFWRPGPGLCAE